MYSTIDLLFNASCYVGSCRFFVLNLLILPVLQWLVFCLSNLVQWPPFVLGEKFLHTEMFLTLEQALNTWHKVWPIDLQREISGSNGVLTPMKYNWAPLYCKLLVCGGILSFVFFFCLFSMAWLFVCQTWLNVLLLFWLKHFWVQNKYLNLWEALKIGRKFWIIALQREISSRNGTRGRLCTVELLFKAICLFKEVNCTESFLSISVPWVIFLSLKHRASCPLV